MNIRNLPKQKKVALILLLVAAIILALALLTPHFPWNQKAKSYDDCVKQGNPILDSYPSVCVGKDGTHFTNPAERPPVIPR